MALVLLPYDIVGVVVEEKTTAVSRDDDVI